MDKEDSESEDNREHNQLPPVPEFHGKLPRVPHKKEGTGDYQRMGIAYSVPAALAAPVVVLTLFGAWLDSKTHFSPWFTIGGALLGMISGLINMVRLVNRLNK
jgi:F0F1-type ATP synthase assembly protein I